MGEDGESTIPNRAAAEGWIRWLLIGLGTIFLLLVVFHGTDSALGRALVSRQAGGRGNLKLEFRIEGDVLGGVTLRNVHAIATGPSAVRSVDADLVRADYSLTELVFHGTSIFLKDVEVRNLKAVIDPAKAPMPQADASAEQNHPARDFSRPAGSDERKPNDPRPARRYGRANFNLGLYPDREGALRIDKVQIPNVLRGRMSQRRRPTRIRICFCAT